MLISLAAMSISSSITIGILTQFLVLDFFFLLIGLLFVHRFYRTQFKYLGSATQPRGKNILIYGTNINSRMMFYKVKNLTNKKYNIIGFIDDNSESAVTELYDYPVINGKQQFVTLLRYQKIDQIYISSRDIKTNNMESLKNLRIQAGIKLIQLDVSLPDLLSAHLNNDTISSRLNSAQLFPTN